MDGKRYWRSSASWDELNVLLSNISAGKIFHFLEKKTLLGWILIFLIIVSWIFDKKIKSTIKNESPSWNELKKYFMFWNRKHWWKLNIYEKCFILRWILWGFKINRRFIFEYLCRKNISFLEEKILIKDGLNVSLWDGSSRSWNLGLIVVLFLNTCIRKISRFGLENMENLGMDSLNLRINVLFSNTKKRFILG